MVKRLVKKLSRFLLFLAVVLVLPVLVVEFLFHFVSPLDRFVTFQDALTAQKSGGPNAEYVYKGMSVGSFAEFMVTVRRNSLGFHEREYESRKRDGVYRVLLLGDSLVEAKQVPLETTFHERVERKFVEEGEAVEIIAFGDGGEGPERAVEIYEELGRNFKPDLVVWAFTDVNDVTDSSPELKRRIYQYNTRHLRKPPRWLFASACASFLWTRLSLIGDSDSQAEGFFQGEFSKLNEIRFFDIVCLKEWPPAWEEARVLFENYTRALVDAVRSDGLPFIAISIAGRYVYWLPSRHKELEWDVQKPERIVRGIVEARGGSFLTFKPRLSELKEGFTFPKDGHFNDYGHEVVAEAFYAAIEARLPAR